MANRPTASTSRAGRPRTRSRSVHLPTCILVAFKAVRPRTQSVQKSQVKGKGTGKGKGAKKKLGKAVVVISSESEDSKVDFLHHPPYQPVNLPGEEPQDPNQPLDIPAKGPEEQGELNQPINIPAKGAEEPLEPNNPNPLPENPPIPMANN